MLVLNAAEVLEDCFDRAAVLFFQAINGDETIFDLIEPLRIVPHVLAQRCERARDLLQSIQHVLQFIRDPLDLGDVARERLQQVRSARDL